MTLVHRMLPAVSVLIVIASLLCGPAWAFENLPVSFFCIEAESGMILMEENADLKRPPASMVKMMLLLLIDEGVQAGTWRYDTSISVSALAQSMGGTQVYLARGESWPLETLTQAIAVASANDAAVAIAEGLWGSVPEALVAMNKRAAELGMEHTVFNSVHGLPPSDGKSFDQTTAREMARLGQELLKHPKILTFTSTKEFALRPENAARSNTNQLLARMEGCDGLKTGYIRAAGFCLTATAKRDNIRLISVVMGSDRSGRFSHSQEIVEKGFGMVQRVTPVRAGTRVGRTIPVSRGLTAETGLLATGDIEVVVRHEDIEKLILEITAPTHLEAPVEPLIEAGKVRLVLEGRILGETTLIIADAVERRLFKHRVRELIGLDP